MIYPDQRVPASGPRSANIAAIGMSPARWEIAARRPFVGSSGRILDDCLAANKVNRASIFATNLVGFYIDDNDLYSVPQELLERERQRVFRELDEVKPNVLMILGGDTLDLLTSHHYTTKSRGKRHKKAGQSYIATHGGKEGITKWRGSTFLLDTPSGRKQKCVAMMHPANFIRGQWKWLPVFKYIDVAKAVTQSSSSQLALTPRNRITAPSFQVARDYLQTAMTQSEVSIDYEGSKHLSCLGVGWSASEAICIPLSTVGAPTYYSLEEELQLWKLWCALLENPNVEIIAQNAAFEWIKSWVHGIYPTSLGIDTMHLHHCLYPDFGGVDDEWTQRKRKNDNPGHGLAFIVSQYTDHPFYKDDGRHWRPELGPELFWQYNCNDVMLTFEGAVKMRNEAKQLNLWDTYTSLYRDTFENALRIEWLGTPINTGLRDQSRRETLGEIATICNRLSDIINRPVITKRWPNAPKDAFNLSSPPQMKRFLQNRGYKLRLDRRTGQETSDKDTLQMLYSKSKDEVLKDIMEVRHLQDFVNDILDQKLDRFNRIHCHVKLGGTNGTRRSTTESILGGGTNLQNLPRNGIARRLFLP